MRIYQLSKTVLSFKKEGIEDFLNGLTSNHMQAQYNAFLTIHGKIVATLDQKKISNGEYIILIEKEYKNNLLDHLDRYIKLGGVVVEEMNSCVYFDLDNELDVLDGELIFEQKSGRIIISAREIESTVSEDEFKLFRVMNGLPIQGVDYKDEMLLNVSTEDYVSFDKGCFLGQEPLSKVFNRSKPTWKLVVKSTDECNDTEIGKMTSAVTDSSTGKTIGFVFQKND